MRSNHSTSRYSNTIQPAGLCFRAVCLSCLIVSGGALLVSAAKVTPPAPYGATPTERQVRHAEREMYAFCHFTVDTFTDAEWGSGAEKPAIFNPTQFDANQIVGAVKAAGCKGIILTCKHHDGFCLWPTKTTGHNVSASPFRGGKGDVVREMVTACKKADIEFGAYLSPWDRNNEHYGTPTYVTDVYRKQLRELATNYGPIFEFWFDGANGGSGYYGGKGGSRSIDRSKYYEWPINWQMLRELQPNAVIFSDVGPDFRWCGNEHGASADPCRATITYDPGAAPGHLNSSKLGCGMLGGKVWCPAEVDVSIRPGWYWHASQNGRVRSPENLMHIYMNSVGHGATFNLNCPPDRRGLLHENDVASLKTFGDHLRRTFAVNLAAGAKVQASNVRGGDDRHYGPGKLLDYDRWSAWVTDDAVTTPEVTLELKGDKTFNMIRLREDIRFGLRVDGVAVDAWVDGQWK